MLSLHAEETPLLKLEQKIPLSDVKGRIDHMAMDSKGARLFVAALGNNTVEVVDTSAAQRVHTIKDLHEPQGVVYIPGLDKIAVANGEGGALQIYDGKSFALLKSFDFEDDADNLRYDEAAKQIFAGYGKGAIGIIDASTNTRVKDIKLAAHPESFQLESKGKRIFVNVPSAHLVQVIDRDKAAVIANWEIKEAKGNFPMALDEANHRLFVVCRSPARLLVLDAESGKVVANLECVGDADDVFYDSNSKRIYISGGEGFISIFEQSGADTYKPLEEFATAPGARTSLYLPEQHTIYVAVPLRGEQAAGLSVYKINP